MNDNFGDWKSDWKSIFEKCSGEDCLGRRLASILRPSEQDLFVVKRKHSGFYATNLEPLLNELKVNQLIITGIAGNICVLFTAHDAYMREYDVVVPKDCVASNTATADRFLIHQLQKTLKFPMTHSENIRL